VSCHSESPDGSRLWSGPDGLHLDVRSLDCPEPLLEILKLIDSGQAGNVLMVHLDQEPVFLYPELDDRGWTHEVVPGDCGDPACGNEVRLRLVRMSA
jgi:hypothetical protein